MNQIHFKMFYSFFFRLVCYQPEESRATLSAQHASKEHRVVVHTLFVEPFNPIIGAQYTVLGEIENDESKRNISHRQTVCKNVAGDCSDVNLPSHNLKMGNIKQVSVCPVCG